MSSVKPPKNIEAPFCKCGCGNRVTWGPGKGWFSYCKGHHMKGTPGTRLGSVTSEITKQRQSEAAKLRYAGTRRRDLEDIPGLGVYATYEYKNARKQVQNKSCTFCGTPENVHAHHVVPGNDTTLIPVCGKCHPTVHASPGAKGKYPPHNEVPPLCKCGCGQPVKWKRVRGWAEYRKGHGSAKIPAGTSKQKPLLCKCGCGEQVKFRHGKGWNEYKRGHRQRIEGHYRRRDLSKWLIQ